MGARIAFDGTERLVVRLAGTAVWLRVQSGGEQVVLAGHLMGAVDFAVLDAAGEPAAPPMVESFGLVQTLPEQVLQAAQR